MVVWKLLGFFVVVCSLLVFFLFYVGFWFCGREVWKLRIFRRSWFVLFVWSIFRIWCLLSVVIIFVVVVCIVVGCWVEVSFFVLNVGIYWCLLCCDLIGFWLGWWRRYGVGVWVLCFWVFVVVIGSCCGFFVRMISDLCVWYVGSFRSIRFMLWYLLMRFLRVIGRNFLSFSVILCLKWRKLCIYRM